MRPPEPVGGRAGVPAGFTIVVDGEPVPVRTGQTLAAALLAAGRRTTRRTRFAGRPRGVFCGIGICFDCLVVCNGEPGVRACLRPAAPGDTVETGRDERRPAHQPRPGGRAGQLDAGSGRAAEPGDVLGSGPGAGEAVR
ncbi:2Fe-2S iron-sulfur cluster-binding protein [Plantactinospora sp. KLBMP9567]|uniref:2Fe-2S iron-sulfur cluster-binding protein n=1 Tax=Plantactinospora sp. KLBMP9567 TaxID=3085900 RepID=UPI002981C664|nr:2Fe-2S iron-sulfur cluster-binding protein [Plantactinospora sp. KLBMP9567]MDW5330847.1 2Fe-2S iron-sulfur cluster-binding protein [Plantactinospora sp. KLBMP9567]